MNYLVLDIETVPDSHVWTSPDVSPGHEKPFPPAYAHKTIVIGCMFIDQDYQLKKLGFLGEPGKNTTEEELLADLSKFINQNKPVLITYNGRCFDFPVLALRSLHHGISMQWYYDRDVRYRYTDKRHIDLCDWFADHGAIKYTSLDSLAKIIGLPGKTGVDGSKVSELFDNGFIDKIQNYCLQDVVQTAFLFLRLHLLQGKISQNNYRNIATFWVDELSKDSRVDDVINNIDRSRLLIEI